MRNLGIFYLSLAQHETDGRGRGRCLGRIYTADTKGLSQTEMPGTFVHDLVLPRTICIVRNSLVFATKSLTE